MSQFREAFNAGREAVKKRRVLMMWCLCGFMGLNAMIQEYLRNNYVTAALAPVFFLLIMPWVARKWFRSSE
jgi:hypothetical protein